MKKIILFLIFIICMNYIYGDVCQDNEPMGQPCSDLVKVQTNCDYVDIYYSNGSLQSQVNMNYLYGSWYYNYSINLLQSDYYTLRFCDGVTYTYIYMYDPTIPFYMILNNTFLRDADILKINIYVNITNDTILSTNFSLFKPDGTLYDSQNLSPGNSITGYYLYNNTALSNISSGYWKARLYTVGGNNTYENNQTFKVNSINKTLPSCDITNITYTYYIPLYCNLNTNCFVYFYPNVDSATGLNSTSFIVFNDSTYNMFYTNNYWYSIIITNVNEDISFQMMTYYSNGSALYCSELQSGTIKFRQAHNVDIELFTAGVFNTTKAYKNEFDYLYLIYTNQTMGVNAPNIQQQKQSLDQVTNWMRKYNQKKYGVTVGTALPDLGDYFWGEYINGHANIKLYEEGGYDLYILNSPTDVNSSPFVEFEKPARSDTIEYENILFKGLSINSSVTNIHHKISIYQANGKTMTPKILWTILYIVILAIIIGLICLIPFVGVPIASIISPILIIITIILIIIKWLG